ncbi:MAG: glycerophosphodiester phosphodiesterase [Chloroflexota bacterium]
MEASAPEKRPLIVAHRGAAWEAPENTLAAFALAVVAGADMVELDVRVSADGELVVIHDAEVSRTTNGRGDVAALTLAELKALDAGAWFAPPFAGEQVPTLAEVCAFAAGRIALNVEVKCDAAVFAPLADTFVATLGRHGLLANGVVSSFDRAVLRALREASADVSLAYLYMVQWFSPGAPELRELALNALHPEHRLVTARQVAEAHAAGMRVNVWTVDDVPSARELASWGVDGLITNDPALLAALFASGASSNRG